MRAVLVGATGAVGMQMLTILEERGFLPEDLVLVASARSAGKQLPYAGKQLEVVTLGPDVFEKGDLALFDVPDEVSKEWAPIAAERGAIVIDNSAAWRMHEEVPLVVPEINPEDAQERPLGIIASPNCTTLTMIVPLAALHAQARLERVVAASYQATSGTGRPGVTELWGQLLDATEMPDKVTIGRAGDVLEAGEAYPHPIALNVLPHAGSFKENGYTSEEIKMCYETRKIMGMPDLRVTATCVRVPVMVGHSVAVHAAFSRPIDPDEARKILEDADGVEVLDDPANAVYPTPLQAAGSDPCYVGRIRQDPWESNVLEMFCVADNLRKGAALNTVQIAELLVGR